MGFLVALVVKNSPANAGDVRGDISEQLDSAVVNPLGRWG